MNYLPQQTIRYKTYLKSAMVEAFRNVFAHHPDALLQKTNVTIDFPRTKVEYPALIVRFFERSINNAGVGHFEFQQTDNGNTYKFKHYFYNGDVELAVYALSSLDRDLITDSVVEIIAFGDLQPYTNEFLNRIYPRDDHIDYAPFHYVNVRTDNIQGFGETQTPVPWAAEDDLSYQASYRITVSGEFYSLPPDTPHVLITDVTQYPSMYEETPGDFEPISEGDPNNDAHWEDFSGIDE